MVEALLARGFDPNSRDENGQVALYLALRAGSNRVADLLMRHPQLQPDLANSAAETPLMMAALKGNQEAAVRLLSLGSKPHQEGWSPVHYAATGTQTQIVELLLDRGAPIEARSPNGTTPLMMAAYGAEATVNLLLARGAEIGQRNDRGLSAADFARLGGRDRLSARLESSAH
jgi:ankyrin repeat protein